MENLAPAGNREALDRAVAAGADAVYLGYAAFSARAGAGNFDEEQLREAVHFAHLHHVRVHATVNTLVKDSELPELLRVLRILNDARVDAVLVQDLGVLALCRACFPSLAIHASTQMALHNATGVRFAKRMGMTRVVLARECSLSEIALCASEGLEIEVFGHGAQCVAVSGECLFSSMVGERSGNRGRCAQPCRLQYTYRGKRGAWLSPRDVCMRNDVDRLAKAGVASLKLEGRLKRPEYVAAVASSYRRAIDSVVNGCFQKADGAEMQDLMQIFQRGGFMRGYAMGAEDAGVICEDRVNHSGLYLGDVVSVRGELAKVRLALDLHDGDGLQLRTAAGDAEMIYAGRDTPQGGIATLRIRGDMRLRSGDQVYRLTDSDQLSRARAMTIPPIPVDAWLSALPGEALRLTVSDGESFATFEGDRVEEAKSRAMTLEDARRCMEKTGDTPFALRRLEVQTERAFVPVSVLNAARRTALSQLAQKRAERFAHPRSEDKPAPPCSLPARDVPPLVVVRTMAQLPLARQLAGEGARIAWYPEDWREDALADGLQAMPQGMWLHLPVTCEEATIRMLVRLTEQWKGRLGGVVLGSVGQLGASWPVPFGAGMGIPVMNRRAAALLLDAGCAFVTASCELTAQELKTLLAGRPPILVQAYGRTQLMLLHHCPARTLLGLETGHAACRMCDQNAPDALRGTTLEDRRGYAYPLLRQRLPEGCLVRLMNALPTDVRAQVSAQGYTPFLELTDEMTLDDLPDRTTQGHWNRAVD